MSDVDNCVIGIDLGTTYSCVGVCIQNKVVIIENDIGKKTTPSHVAFDDDGNVLIGDTAKYQTDIHPEFSIFDVKRLIGRNFHDPIVQKDIKYWPFQVIEGKKDTPKIKLPNEKTFLPEQISAKVLSYLKKQAEGYLQTDVKNAVITVPAYFNDGQRQATRDAGAIAGLNVLKIINEPTAAAIAYNFQRKSPNLKTVLVFDLGGGTFDVFILRMQGKDIEVLGVGGDTHLGGEDFDIAMLEYCIKEFKGEKGVDLNEGKNSSVELERNKANLRFRRLKNECEKEKIHLSASKKVYISLDAFYNETSMHIEIKRETFESINKGVFDKCLETMGKVIKDAKLTKESIDDVILVGGSSKIPAIQERIKNYFDGKKPLQTIRGDEAVDYGAALQASMLSPKRESSNTETVDFYIKDVYPLPVGIKVYTNGADKNDFSPIIPKNTSVPCKKTQRYATVNDNQKSVTISIYEGENTSVSKNHLLGTFVVNNLPTNCLKDEPIDVTMEFNCEGILHCTAICPKNDATNKIEVVETKGRLTYEDIQRMKKEEM